MADVRPFWILVAGVVLLSVFLIAFAFRSRLGPGGTRRYGPSVSTWLGPGGTRHLLGSSTQSDNAFHSYERFANPGAEPSTLYMIGVDWCPHCKSAKPGFQGMGSTATIAGQPIALQYLDGEKDKDRLPACEVGGYPTFCFLHKGKAHRYQGPRSPEGYKSFVQKVLNTGSA
jgi:hypothetical protein